LGLTLRTVSWDGSLRQIVGVEASTGTLDKSLQRIGDTEHTILNLRSEDARDHAAAKIGEHVEHDEALILTLRTHDEKASTLAHRTRSGLVDVEMHRMGIARAVHHQSILETEQTVAMPEMDDPLRDVVAQHPCLGDLRKNLSISGRIEDSLPHRVGRSADPLPTHASIKTYPSDQLRLLPLDEAAMSEAGLLLRREVIDPILLGLSRG
jgi:hypothetical protein